MRCLLLNEVSPLVASVLQLLASLGAQITKALKAVVLGYCGQKEAHRSTLALYRRSNLVGPPRCP